MFGCILRQRQHIAGRREAALKARNLVRPDGEAAVEAGLDGAIATFVMVRV